jgi:hypothetical protein
LHWLRFSCPDARRSPLETPLSFSTANLQATSLVARCSYVRPRESRTRESFSANEDVGAPMPSARLVPAPPDDQISTINARPLGPIPHHARLGPLASPHRRGVRFPSRHQHSSASSRKPFPPRSIAPAALRPLPSKANPSLAFCCAPEPNYKMLT